MPRQKTHHITRRRSRTIPWGYRVSDHDEELIEPIPEIVELLDVAERAWLAKTASYQDIARWVSGRAKALGYMRSITGVGLKKRLFNTPKNIKKFAVRHA